MAVTIPTTSPAILTKGPPELPELAAASNWMSPRKERNSSTLNSRANPETTPADTDGPIPKGNPTATTSSPGKSSWLEPRTAGCKSSGNLSGLRIAKSFSGRTPMTLASDSNPS